MCRSLLLLLTFLVFHHLPSALGANDPQLAGLKAADDARVAAFIAADRGRLQELLSEDLRYAHSSGNVDSKASLTDAMTAGRLKYTGIDYDERDFTFPASDMALMFGRVHLHVAAANGPIDIPASYLAVWRKENGQWHFLAWQSAKLPPAAAK